MLGIGIGANLGLLDQNLLASTFFGTWNDFAVWVDTSNWTEF